MTVPIPIPLVLSKSQAGALAQFVKRADRETALRHAGNQHEADAIFDAWLELRSALAVAGFAPR